MSPTGATREKRRFDRIPAQHIVSFAELSRGWPREPTSGLGRTLDMGAGGACLETAHPLQVGQTLQLEIALGSQIIHADATVVHVSVRDTDMVTAGLSFDRVPSSDRETLLALGIDQLT